MNARRVLVASIVLEIALVVVAVLASRLTGTAFRFGFGAAGIVAGIGVGAAMTLAVVGLVNRPWRLTRRLRADLDRVLELFSGFGTFELLVASVLAGIGEELLFRGFLQEWLGGYWGVHAAVIAVALLFGLVHAISPSYFAFATVLGLVLGYTYQLTGSLVAAMLAHALYDFAALLYGTRVLQGGRVEHAPDPR